jgi:hypothetical protein
MLPATFPLVPSLLQRLLPHGFPPQEGRAALASATLALAQAFATPALAQTAPPHVLPNGQVPPNLAAARTHMLEAPETC